MDRELLDAIRAVIREEIKPLDDQLSGVNNRLSIVENKIDYLTSVVDEALVLHDELEERVKVLESKAI